MSKEKTKQINWLADVESHDYPAAESYLLILYSPVRVAEIVAQLRSAAIGQFKICSRISKGTSKMVSMNNQSPDAPG